MTRHANLRRRPLLCQGGAHRRRTLFVSAATLLTMLTKAHADGRLEERLGHFAKPKLLIVDELGYLPLESTPPPSAAL